MAALNCIYCERKWPKHAEYRECPVCREKTNEVYARAMDSEEAARVKDEFDFGWWLWDNGRL